MFPQMIIIIILICHQTIWNNKFKVIFQHFKVPKTASLNPKTFLEPSLGQFHLRNPEIDPT